MNNEKDNKKIVTVVFLVCVVSLVGFLGYRTIISYTDNEMDGMRYFIDSHDRNITVPLDPMRIISMAPSITETLFALGIQDRLIGVTDYCNYPEEAQNITSIGGFSTPDLEVMISLNPDLIIANSYDADAIITLQDIGFVVAVMEDSNTFEGIIDNILDIGDLVDAKSNAINITDTMYDRLWVVTNKTATIEETSKVDLYFEIFYFESPMVVGNQSFIHDMILKAGGNNIFGNLNSEYPIVSNENVISNNTDYIFITEHSAAWYSQDVCDRIGYDILNACKNEHVYTVNDDLYLRAGPRIVDALINMTNILYPELLN